MMQQRFQPYLLPGERVLWTGQPDPGILFSRIDIFLIPFSLVWGGFSFLWEAIAVYGTIRGWGKEPVILFFPLFGSFFVIVGLYMIAGRFLVQRWVKRRTYYALTDQRALALEEFLSARVRSIDLRANPAIDLTVRSSGAGTLRFDQPYPAMSWSASVEWFGGGWGEKGITFRDVPDIRRVYELVNGLKRDRPGGTS